MKCLKRLPDGRVGLDFTYSYPHNPDWIFTTELERINFDEERVQDIRSGNGFIVSPTNGIKKKEITFDYFFLKIDFINSIIATTSRNMKDIAK